MDLQKTLAQATSLDFNSLLPIINDLKNSGQQKQAVFIINSILQHDVNTEIKRALYHELSICLFYTDYKELGPKVLDHLLLKGDLGSIEFSNQAFYAPKIKIIEKYKPEIKCPLVKGSNQTYKPMNPSILKYKNGWLGLSRLVNYTQERATNFKFISSDGVCRTKLVLLLMDKNFRVTYQTILKDKSNRIRYEHSRVRYFEDAIPFWDNHELYMLSNALDGNPNGMSVIYRCKIDIEAGEIVEAKPLASPQNRVEKNWLPMTIPDKKGIHYLYSYDPVIILNDQLDLKQYNQKRRFGTFRGGGGVVNYEIESEKGYLVIVHEVGLYPGNSGRCYLHRFIWLNAEFEIKKMSHCWIFEHQGIEYCRSMIIDDNKLILGVGIEDRESWYYVIDAELPKKQLIDIRDFD